MTVINPEWVTKEVGSFQTAEEMNTLATAVKNNAVELQTDITNLSIHVNNKSNPHEVTKAQVGLSEVDNTSDLNKPISIAQQTAINAASTTFNNHVNDTDNPHDVTKIQLGLSNVDNTSDLLKPISTATQNALDTKEDISNKGIAGGYAGLDANGKVPENQLPSSTNDVLEYISFSYFPSIGESGKIYIAKDTNKLYRWEDSTYIYIKSGAVDSVAGKVGIVTLDKNDVGLPNVDNTSDMDKPISNAQNIAFNDLRDDINGHEARTDNPHSVTKAQIGLNAVDNTSDANKPISLATQTALNLKADKTRQIIAGTGLTGGGDLSADRTINVVSANDGITANADNIQLNTIDNVTTTSITKPLSANQGKVLDEKITQVGADLNESIYKKTNLQYTNIRENQRITYLGSQASDVNYDILGFPITEGDRIQLIGKVDTFCRSIFSKAFVIGDQYELSTLHTNTQAPGTVVDVNVIMIAPTGTNWVMISKSKTLDLSVNKLASIDDRINASANNILDEVKLDFNNKYDMLSYLSLDRTGESIVERNNALTGFNRALIQVVTPKLKTIVGSDRIKFVTDSWAGLESLSVERINSNKIFGLKPILGKFRASANPSNTYTQKAIIKVTKNDLQTLGLTFSDDTATVVDISTGILRLASTDPYFSNKQIFVEICYGETEDSFLSYNTFYIGDNQVNYIFNDGALVNSDTNLPVDSLIWQTNNPSKNFNLKASAYNFASTGSNGGNWYEKFEANVYNSVIPKNGGTAVQFVGIQITFLPQTKAANHNYCILPTFINSHMEGFLTEDTLPVNIPDDLIQFMTKEKMMQDGKIKSEFIPDFDTNTKKTVNVQNSDKIAMYGCSYTESYFSLRKKSWMNKLSNMLDIQFANFGVSGNRIVDINKRMRENSNPYHSTIGIKEIKPTYIAIQNIGNETLNVSGNNLDFYLGEVAEAAELVNSYGAKLMLGTDWTIGNPSVDTLLSDYANQNGCLYYGVGTISSKILANKYPGFWGGAHPATRTNATIWQEYLNFMRNLNVKQCVKVFRVRDEFKLGSPTIQDLNYDTISQRMKKWNEINVGEIHLSDTIPGYDYYDRLNETKEGGEWAYNITKANNEYCNLIAKQNVAFNNWSLVEFILPVVKVDSVKAYVKSSDTNLKFYIKQSADISYQYGTERNYCMFKVDKTVYDSFSSIEVDTQYKASILIDDILKYKGRLKGYDYPGYYLNFYNSTDADNASGGSGILTPVLAGNDVNYLSADSGLGRHSYGFFDSCLKPLANFEEVSSIYNSTSGYYELDITDYKYMQYDKLRIVIGKTGEFNISDIYCSVEGGIEKRMDKNILKPLKRQGNELMSDTGMGVTYNSQWELTTGAEFGTIPIAINQYPGFNSSYKSFIKLGFDSENFPGVMKKVFTISEARGYRDVIIRVTARLFPKVYDITKTPDDVYTNVQQITPTSYDLGTLCVGLKMGTSIPSVERRMIDVGWAELEIMTCIPPYVTNMEVSFWRDYRDLENTDYNSISWPMQVCDASIQIL